MALIKNVTRIIRKNPRVNPSSTNLAFFTFMENGKRYIQIETEGAKDRATPGHSNQVMQFEESVWKQLVGESFIFPF